MSGMNGENTNGANAVGSTTIITTATITADITIPITARQSGTVITTPTDTGIHMGAKETARLRLRF
jgi:hypothetical protein